MGSRYHEGLSNRQGPAGVSRPVGQGEISPLFVLRGYICLTH